MKKRRELFYFLKRQLENERRNCKTLPDYDPSATDGGNRSRVSELRTRRCGEDDAKRVTSLKITHFTRRSKPPSGYPLMKPQHPPRQIALVYAVNRFVRGGIAFL